MLVMLLLFWNFKRYKDSRIRTNEAIRSISDHVDRKYDLSFGELYLYLNFRGENFAVPSFVNLLKIGFKGMLVFQEKSVDVANLDPKATKNIEKKLTLSRAKKQGRNPTKLDFILEDIEGFIEEIKQEKLEGIVFINDLDFLIKENGEKRTEEFLNRLKSSAKGKKTMVFIALNPEAVKNSFVKWMRTITKDGNTFWVSDEALKTVGR